MPCRTPACASSARRRRKMANGADRRLFWVTAVAVGVADVVTKLLAESLLARHLPVQLVGDFVQLRLVYNQCAAFGLCLGAYSRWIFFALAIAALFVRSEEHTSELQSQSNLVCRLLLEKKKKKTYESYVPIDTHIPRLYALNRNATLVHQ